MFKSNIHHELDSRRYCVLLIRQSGSGAFVCAHVSRRKANTHVV